MTPFVSLLWLSSLSPDFALLEKRFEQPVVSRSTRIYAQIPQIAVGEPKRIALEALRDGNVSYSQDPQSSAIVFTWKAWSHPKEFLPAVLAASTEPMDTHVRVEFGGTDSDEVLSKISVGAVEVPRLPLEPELIATLAGDSESGAESTLRSPLAFETIPAAVWQAIIAVEDQHFLEHRGWDPRGLFRAIWVNLKTLSFAQGGSTITQQLTKNLLRRRTKNPYRKVLELFYSMALEAKYPKEKILERYLNEVYLGQIGPYEVHGIAEGARLFFGKSVQDVNVAEIALIAGLIRGPAYYSPYKHWERALERSHWVLNRMVETGMIAEEERQEALRLPLRLVPPQVQTNAAPAFVDLVQKEMAAVFEDKAEERNDWAGYSVYTTLNLALQNEIEKKANQRLIELEKSLKLPGHPLQLAFVGMDLESGGILSLLGARDFATSNFNRVLLTRRQVGSTFKPIVYLSALQKKTDPRGLPYSGGYPIEDAPWSLKYDRGRKVWQPRNDDPQFRGWIPLRTALAHSVNTATARLAYDVGGPALLKTSQELGLLADETEFLPSRALGTAEVSSLELTRAYAQIAHGGAPFPPHTLVAVAEDDGPLIYQTQPRPPQEEAGGIASLPYALLTDLLQGVFQEGTARSAATLGWTRPAAGKTGTTNGYRDAWFVGFTPQRLAVTWVGWDQGTAPKSLKLTGARAALPIWVDWMKVAHRELPELPFPPHPLAVAVKVDRKTGRPASEECPESQLETTLYPQELLPEDSSIHTSNCRESLPPSRSEGVW